MEAAFASALTFAMERMLSPHTSQQLLRVGASEENLRTMNKKFRSIQLLAEDVSYKSEWKKELTHWLRKVNGLTFLVLNTIDEYEYGMHFREDEGSSKKISVFSIECRMHLRVKKILWWLSELQKEARKLGLEEMNELRARSSGSSGFVGRTADETKIVQKLHDNDGNSIVAIVGMPGIGKTTVANRIYESETSAAGNPFAMRFWVEVEGIIDIERISTGMLQKLEGGMLNPMDSEDILSKLVEAVKNQRILLVLDDVRSLDQEKFKNLMSHMQRNGTKISVLVTTRSIEIARTIDASYIHDLQGLSDDDSCNLFISVASRIRSTIVGEMEIVGRHIVQKSQGVPLLIRKMASLLQSKIYASEWMMLVESELWDLRGFKMVSTLSLTDDLLPKALKRCFAYCSIFAKHAVIQRSDLIGLWLAQGFLSEETTDKSIETGEKFFDILLNESLLQEHKKDEDENVVECTMHDLAHDLAVNFSRHDVFINDGQGNQPSRQSDVQHLVFSSLNMKEEDKVIYQSTRLRTIYLMGAMPENKVHPIVAELETILSRARYLYVLVLDGIGLKEAPKNLGKLNHLRYLDLSNNPIKYIPESITHLYLLQTLLLRNCEKLENTENPPEGITKLKYLKFFEVSPKQVSPNMLPPTTLIRLPSIKLDEQGASVEMNKLHNLTNIAGRLSISGLEYLKDKEAAQEAMIGKKHSLSTLELHWSRETEGVNSQDKEVLHGFQPHSNIRRLKLVNYNSEQFPFWMENMKGEDNERFYRLVKIELVKCKNCLQVPTMGQLPCLRDLLIAGMDNIEKIGDEFYNYANERGNYALDIYFPGLRRLELRDLTKLTEWKPVPTNDRINICRAFVNLETLQIVNCPNLTNIPTSFPSIKCMLIKRIQKHNWLDDIIVNSHKKHTLTSLVLCRVSKLTTLPQELCQCTSLEELSLEKCQEFKDWPQYPWNLISLKKLCIDDCYSLKDPPKVKDLTALTTFVIRGCQSLEKAQFDPQEYIPITRLAFTSCNQLNWIPDLQKLTNLEELDILDVNMKSLPPGLHALPSLRIMRVGGLCDMFDHFPQCNSLERLWLKGTPKTRAIPHRLKELKQLKVLRVRSFGKLTKIPDWICNLEDLEILIFEECHKLAKFPTRDDMLKLKKLRCLRIENCPILETNFDEERSKICHVPHVKIKGFWLQGDRSFLLQERSLINVPWSRSFTESEVAEEENEDSATTLYELVYETCCGVIKDTLMYCTGGRSFDHLYFKAFCVFIIVLNCLFYWDPIKQH